MLDDVLNDFTRRSDGALELPNLVVDIPVLVFIRLSVPARSKGGTLGTVRLSWDGAKGGSRRDLAAPIELPEAMPLEWWMAMPEDPMVVEQEALLMAARAQKEAAKAIDRGDVNLARRNLDIARQCTFSVPISAQISEELHALDLVEEALDRGEHLKMSKQAKMNTYRRSHGQSRRKPSEPPTA